MKVTIQTDPLHPPIATPWVPRVGDRVRIVDEPPENRTEGPCWVEDMDLLTGQTGVVVDVYDPDNPDSILVDIDADVPGADAFFYLPEWLVPLGGRP